LDTLDYTAAIQLSKEALVFYQNLKENTPKIGVAYALLGDASREQGKQQKIKQQKIISSKTMVHNMQLLRKPIMI